MLIFLQTIDMCDYSTPRSFVKRTGKVCRLCVCVRVVCVCVDMCV